MEYAHSHALAVQFFSQPLSRPLGANKNQRAPGFFIEQTLQQRKLLVGMDFISQKIHGFGGLLRRSKSQADSSARVIVNQVLNGWFKSGGETERLPGLWQSADDPADSGNESHIQHSVHFVQHQDFY